MSKETVTSADAGTAARAVPIVFQAAGAWCFGWFHAARGRPRGAGVVLCRPFGYEAICAYRTYTVLAGMLADSGFDVIRFDYHGTGDSAGTDLDPGRVAAWLGSIAAAVRELHELADVSRIALFGVRLGATLAARAAARLGGVDALVLWAPCTGRSFARELRAASAAAGALDSSSGDVEALGYLYTADTLRELEALDRETDSVVPARCALIVNRDDMPGSGPLPEKLRAMGVATSCVDWPGYAGMMVEPHDAVLTESTLQLIAQWLSGAAGFAAGPHRARSAVTREAAHGLLDGVREVPLLFGPRGSLFGIVSEPAAWPAADGHPETALLMLNVGANHHIGPNRNYVRFARSLAASGYRALRMDLSGIGDSGDAAAFCRADLYSAGSVAEVAAAIDCLAERGCKRFFLMGICSGSYVAFQTALVDARVTGQILINSRLLEWNRDQEGGSWEEAMQRPYKSTDFYRRALLNPRVYWRLARGEVDVQGIAGRVRTVIEARLKRAVDRLLRRGVPADGVLAKVKALSARGTMTLTLISTEDDARDYLEFQFGARGKLLRGDPNFKMVLVPDSDHTFSRAANQEFVLAVVREYLEARSPVPPKPTGVYLKGAKIVGAG